MEINPHLNTDSFEAAFKAIDTHTVGEFTRIILSGFPPLKGRYDDRAQELSCKTL